MSLTPNRRAIGTSANGRQIWELGQTTSAAVDRARTGQEAMPEDAWIRAQANRKDMLALSTAIAGAIERAGGTAFREAEPLIELDLATFRERRLAQGFRNNNVIPSVMVSNTRQLRRELGVFVSEHHIAGSSVVVGCDLHGLDTLGAVIEKMGRVASRIRDHLARKFKVDVIFSNTELKAHRDAAGGLVFHVHCHLLIHHMWLPLADFTAMVEHIKQRAPSNYARVEPFELGDSAQSLVRYCITPKLFDNVSMTDEELLALSEAVRGKKMYRPMGAFKTWRKQLRPVRAMVFVAPNPGDADRFYADGTGTVQERARRPAVVTDIGLGCGVDTLAVLADARRAVVEYGRQTGRAVPGRRARILVEGAKAIMGAKAFNDLVRETVRSIRAARPVGGKRLRRIAILRALLARVHASAIAKPRRRTIKSAEKVVHIKDAAGHGANLRFSASSPKPVRFGQRKFIGSDLVIHYATAAPRQTRRMSPAILVAFRSSCSPVGLLIKRGLVPLHLKAMPLWNARCSPEERVPLAAGLMTKPILIDGQHVGSLVNGAWVGTNSPSYRSECIDGQVFIFDVIAEKERAASAQPKPPKGLMTHLYTTTARPRAPSQGRSPPPVVVGQGAGTGRSLTAPAKAA